jgi:hypothetical protein
MRRFTVGAAACAAALAGCPLPQPLPDYPAGTITPPRILQESVTQGVESIIPVPADCATTPAQTLGGRIFYQSNVAVEARWFVDYKSTVPSRYTVLNTNREVPADPDPLNLERQVPPFTFDPYGFPPATELGGAFPSWSAPGIVHVVELVVSNGFDASPAATQPQPNRTPATSTDGLTTFEIQTQRWVFVTVAGLPCP